MKREFKCAFLYYKPLIVAKLRVLYSRRFFAFIVPSNAQSWSCHDIVLVRLRGFGNGVFID